MRALAAYLPATITVFDLDGPRVTHITSFVLPELFSRFGLAEQLPPRR